MTDINKLHEAALELGLKMKVNSDRPGFHFISDNADTRTVRHEELEETTNKIFSYHTEEEM